jgi:hypothetical protein
MLLEIAVGSLTHFIQLKQPPAGPHREFSGKDEAKEIYKYSIMPTGRVVSHVIDIE